LDDFRERCSAFSICSKREALKRLHTELVKIDEDFERRRAPAADFRKAIAAFHGARLNQIGQLRASDVRREGNIRYLNITDEREGNTVKAASSRRRVPIHPVVERLGFLDYVVKVAEERDDRLFLELTPDRMGVVTGTGASGGGSTCGR
jgi:integrase